MNRRLAAVEVVVDLVGDERRERRKQFGNRDQGLAERRDRNRIALPEAPARTAHVPVGEIVDEGGDRATSAGRVEALQRLRDLLDGCRQPRAQPEIKLGLFTFNQVLAGGVFVEDEERVAVPELLEKEPYAVADSVH